MFDKLLVSLDRGLEFRNGEGLVVAVRYENASGAVEIPNVISVKVRNIGAVVYGNLVKTCNDSSQRLIYL